MDDQLMLPPPPPACDVPPKPEVDVEFLSAEIVNFAMAHSGVPVVGSVRVRNRGVVSIAAAALEVQLLPNLGEPKTFQVPLLRPFDSWEPGPLDVPLPSDRLREVIEAETAEVRWTFRAGDQVLAEGSRPIRLLAFNEWPGSAAPAGLLAVFVTPNQPAVARVLQAAHEILARETGDDSIAGYQPRSRKRVLEQVRAVYQAVQQLGISYIGIPASFEETGQKVRMPDQLLAEGMGDCLDLSLLFASCFEQMALNPLIIIVEGHAFPAVWLIDEIFPEGRIDDAARLRTQIQLNQILAFDSSTTVQGERPKLERAVANAVSRLADDEEFVYALDVRAERRAKFRPLPLRAKVDDTPLDGELGSRRKVMFEGDLDVEMAQLEEERRAGSPAKEPTAADPMARRLQKWRERLLDLTLRNRLLNVKLEKGVIPLEVPDLGEFENKLSGDADFDILPEPDIEAKDRRAAKLVEERADPTEERARLLQDLEHQRLKAALSSKDLVATARKLSRDARTDLEEGGATTLYAAVGILRWFESDSSENPRFAPLLLIPVRLVYEPRLDRIKLRRADEDAVGNVTLVEKMKKDFSLDFSVLNEPPEDDQGVDVPLVLRRVRDAVQRVPSWEVLERVYVGRFTFGKFLMWTDLAASEEAILENPLVRHIAEGGRNPFTDDVKVPDERSIDQELKPSELPTVVDADSTQLQAIIAALRGKSMVLHGPPGTGKSQTITNLIAAAIAQEKSVLFVSEKMAALDVVHRRLKEVGLEDFCLELHSNKANKRQVLESLGKALDRVNPAHGSGFEENAETVSRLRKQLNDYVRALHEPRAIGTSFYRVSARVLGLRGKPRLKLDVPSQAELTRERLRELIHAAEDLSTPAARVEPVSAHPWRDAKVECWSGAAESAMREALEEARARLAQTTEMRNEFTRLLGVDPGRSIADVEAAGAAAMPLSEGPIPLSATTAEWPALAARAESLVVKLAEDEEQRAELANRWADDLFGIGDELEDLKDRYERFSSKGPIVRFFRLRAAKGRLRALARGPLPAAPRIAKDLSIVSQCTSRAGSLSRERSAVGEAFRIEAVGAAAPLNSETLRTEIARVRRTVEALSRVPASSAKEAIVAIATGMDAVRCETISRSGKRLVDAVRRAREGIRIAAESMRVADFGTIPHGAGEDELASLRAAVEARLAALPRFRDWAQYRAAAAEARNVKLDALVDAFERGEVRAADLALAVERSVLETWVERVRDSEPVLRDFDGERHSKRVEEFRNADKAHLNLSQERILSALDKARPRGLSSSSAAPSTSEPGILVRELKRKRRQMPLRQLFQKIPGLLPRLKPCFLMSPLSVAQYLPPGGRPFDLVVFDEASQIGTHDAIGAIARGRQAVIVGDSKQLPPTSFFERAMDDPETEIDENDVADLESVLDEAVAAQIPQQSLGWHYRSRHESLIRFSNRHYYEDRLHVFPAARGKVDDLGIKWHAVPDGVYEHGKTRSNPREAKVLVDWLVNELRTTPPGTRTFGVVTFSRPQQFVVLDLLDEARREFLEIEPHFATDQPEPVFVKNLENVQGDERDEILFSICYGPSVDGRVFMRFGPLNLTGGERRLNVAITRARRLLRVFSTISHTEIDPMKTRAKGALHLREFLRYAEEQGNDALTAGVSSQEHDSDFEREVSDALSLLGFEVDAQVGCSGYRIDLGVRHPKSRGVYVLGVECDGAPYHSGATARDRDRLRQSVLEGLGWKLHRIWSTDWWFNREREVEKLRESVEKAIARHDRAEADAAAARAEAEAEKHVTDATTRTQAPTAGTPSDPIVSAPIDADRGATVASRSAVVPERITGIGTERSVSHSAEGSTTEIEDEQNSEVVATEMPPVEVYQRAQLTAASRDPEDLLQPRFRNAIRSRIIEVVRVEGPVHRDAVAKAVTGAFGALRMSERFRRAVVAEVERLGSEGLLVMKGDFAWPTGMNAGTYARLRGADSSGVTRPIDMIAIEELTVAVAWHLERGFSMPVRDLVRLTAKSFGIQRVGKDVESRLQKAIDSVVRAGRARRGEGDRVEWLV